MSSLQRLCRLCEFPAADGGVPLDALDADKLAAWWRCTLGAEFKVETDAQQNVICQFCICEARFVHEHSPNDCSRGNKTGCDWWTGHGDDHFFQHYFYQQPIIRPCKVVLEKTSSGPGYDMLGNTAVLNAYHNNKICSQDELELQLHGCPEQVEIDSNLKTAKKIYRCTLCNKILKWGNNISKHIKIKHKNAVRCKSNHCATYFLTDIERRQHEEKIHPKKNSCIFCGAMLFGSDGILKYHMEQKHKEAIKCDFDYRIHCPKYFKTESEKNKHILEVHNKVDLDPKQCIYCRKTFLGQYCLTLHVKNCHANIQIKCSFRGCGLYFFNQRECDEHFLKKHQHAQSLKKFQCPKCSYRTNRRNNLRYHLLNLHTNKEATFKCPLCLKAFFVKHNLKNHMTTFHGEICTCEHCGKTMQKKSMQLHFLSKHAVGS